MLGNAALGLKICTGGKGAKVGSWECGNAPGSVSLNPEREAKMAAANMPLSATTTSGGLAAPPKPVQEDRWGAIKKAVRQFTPALIWISIATIAFCAAYAWSQASFAVVVYLFALLQLARLPTWRKNYYAGLSVGLFIAASQLTFFWKIFSGGAVALWYVYAFWIGLFVAIAGGWLRRGCASVKAKPSSQPAIWIWLALPFLWTGLEYFRSELYYLRFSWVSPGYAFALAPWEAPLRSLGVYGLGFALMVVACSAAWAWPKSKTGAMVCLLAGAGCLRVWSGTAGQRVDAQGSVIRVAGVQMEQPAEPEVLNRLNILLHTYPDTQLIVLSEYTFNDPVPSKIKEWCRRNQRYLIVGATDPAAGRNYYDTAFVIGPSGEIVFQQAKCVPIQFFKDGLPARKQELWESPWGKLGLCICYDLSYRRVTDHLVALGAQALIVPTMDIVDWGERQHELHARVAPTRAAEYGLPIFRLASSGISQAVDPSGRVRQTAPCPGQGAMLLANLELAGRGKLPLDHWLAPGAVLVAAGMMVWVWLGRTRRSKVEAQG